MTDCLFNQHGANEKIEITFKPGSTMKCQNCSTEISVEGTIQFTLLEHIKINHHIHDKVKLIPAMTCPECGVIRTTLAFQCQDVSIAEGLFGEGVMVGKDVKHS